MQGEKLTQVLINRIVVDISQCTHISKHLIKYFKYKNLVNLTSIAEENENMLNEKRDSRF